MSLPRFVFVTGSADKLDEAERILGFRPESAVVELPEVQSLDLLAVVDAKADEAWRRLRRPLVVEDSGLHLDAMNGFPGPLVKWMLQALGPAGIARAVHALGDAGAETHCALVYRDGERRVVGEGRCRGRLEIAPRGTGGFGWDPHFVPQEERLTCAEMTPSAKDRVAHRGRAWRSLIGALSG